MTAEQPSGLSYWLNAIKQHWQLSLLFLFFLPLLVSLGFWQLDRAEQKRQRVTVYQEQMTLPPKPFNANKQVKETGLDTSFAESYQKVYLEGRYDPDRYWLLDNQSRAGRPGYEVIAPVEVGGQWVLVNRGWVEAPLRREQLPDITIPDAPIRFEGYLYQPSANAVFKQTASDLPFPWPKRVLYIDYVEVGKLLQGRVYPAQLRIDSEVPGALFAHWPIVNSTPEKHQGYAIQWFGMAIILCVLYISALRRRQ